MERAASERTQRLLLILAFGWMIYLAGRHLLNDGTWGVPLLVLDELARTFPTLHIGPYFGEFVRGRLLDLGVVFGVLAAGFAVGTVTFERWLPRRDLLTGLLCLAAGLWMLAVATLAVGVISVAHIPWLFLSLGVWALPAPRKFFTRHSGKSGSRDGWVIFLVVVIVLAAVASLPGALTPPFEYDALEYHLGALTDYQRAGRIVFLPHNFYSNLPQLTEMLYLLVSVASSDIAPQLLHWAFGIMTATGVYAVGTRLWGRNVAWLAAAMFYCTSFVQDLSTTARIDLATAFFATLALGAFLVARNEEPPEWRWWSAVMAGAAVATKWPAVAVVVLPLLIQRRSVRQLIVWSLLAAMVVLPWFVKNWVLAGNPVYPLLNQWFGNPNWSPAQAALFAQKHYPPPWTWGQMGEFFRSLWRYSFDVLQPGPLLLMTAPLVLLVRPANRNARRAGWLVLLGCVGWFCLTFRPWRFLFPVFGVAALVGAYAVTTLARDRWARFAMRLLIGVMLVVNVSVEWVRVTADVEDPRRDPAQLSLLQVMTGQVSTEEMLARLGGGIFEPIIWMNHHLPADAKVLYIGEARLHYTRLPALWSTAFDQHPLAAMLRTAHTPAQLLAELHRQSVTHVYIMFSELDRLRKSYGYLDKIDWALVNQLLADDARPIHVTPTGVVYALTKP